MKNIGIKFLTVIIVASTCMLPSKSHVIQFFESLNIEGLFIDLGPKALLTTFFNATSLESSSDGECLRNLISYKNGLQNNVKWAEKMLDSSSKIPSGLLVGNVFDLGMYDECVSVYVKENGSEIIGRHCKYRFYLSYKNKKTTVNPTLSICLPSSCTQNDLKQVLQKRLKDIEGYEKYQLLNDEVTCYNGHTSSFSVIIVIVFICAIFLVLLIFTILDWMRDENILQPNLPKDLSGLSMTKNLRNIFSLNDAADSISVLHGLRVLSTLSIVLGQSIFIRSFEIYANALELLNTPSFIKIISFFVIFGVDTFFTISGFLVSYLFLKRYVSSNEKFNIWIYYLHRYIRLTPPIAAALCLSMYIVPLLGSGPNWGKMITEFLADSCVHKWWTVLLYINNLVYKDNYCMVHLWSTAVDMQLFLISPLILLPLAKKPKLGLWILFFLLSISIILPAAVTAFNQYPFFINYEMGVAQMMKMFTNLYIPTYTRASSWIIGVILGYVTIKSTNNLKKSTITFWWTLTLVCFLFCAIGFWMLLERNYEYNVIWESIFVSFSRPIWSTGIAWIIFASVQGCGGLIARFLSHPYFLPLSRLSFCLYITHTGQQILNIQTHRSPTYFQLYPLISGFIMDLTLSLLFATIWSILFELPVRNLDKIILNLKLRNEEILRGNNATKEEHNYL